jgi:hypothetical protein
MQVIYRCTTLLHSWLCVQRLENGDVFMEVSTWLKNMAMDIFILHGWAT